jgi:hypothetical protein
MPPPRPDKPSHPMTFEVRIRFAWWLAPYINTLQFFCLAFSCEPDPDKLAKVVQRAVRLEVMPRARISLPPPGDPVQ